MKFSDKTFLSWTLIVSLALAPVFMSSCSKDDDDNGSSSQQQNNNNNNNSNNSSQGEGTFTTSGDVQTNFSGEAHYYDTSNYSLYPTFDNILGIYSSSNDSTSVTAFIVNKNSASIGTGTYKVKNIDSATTKGANVYMNLPSHSTFFSTSSGGSVVINNRSSNTIEGKYNNVMLVEFSTNPDTVVLNGSFKATKY